MLNIVGVKTNKGYYISDEMEGYSRTKLKSYLINGNSPQSTFHNKWVWVKDEPKQVQIYQRQPNINYRYELVDKTLESDRFPLVLLRDDITYTDDDYDRYWKDEYKHLESLYELKYDTQPDRLVDVEFKYQTILELNIDEIKEPTKFSYPIQRTNWISDGLTTISSKDIKHQLIDKIIFPEILLHETPCELSSKQVYDIVRQYIKQNINPQVAEITSDYNFCFTVKKKIALAETYTRQSEITKLNGKSYRPPRYNKSYVSARSVEVFEMTNSTDNYKGYTPIKPITAKNEDELNEKVSKLCQDLIEMINEPLVDCPHCKGMGVILKDE